MPTPREELWERAVRVMPRLGNVLLYCLQQRLDDAWLDVLPCDLHPPLAPAKAADMLERYWKSEPSLPAYLPACACLRACLLHDC